MNDDEQAVANALASYERALNASDTRAIMALYASDGVFMPQNNPSCIGTEAVAKAYDDVFAAITLTVRFALAEVRQLAPDWVLARTNSSGSTEVRATHTQSAEANQELFVFQKIDDTWKIARYCFSTTNPPNA